MQDSPVRSNPNRNERAARDELERAAGYAFNDGRMFRVAEHMEPIADGDDLPLGPLVSKATIHAAMSETDLRALKVELRREALTFDRVLTQTILPKILEWLMELGLPPTLMYFRERGRLVPVLDDKESTRWWNSHGPERVFVATIIDDHAKGGSLAKREAMKHICILFRDVILQMDGTGETVSRPDALKLCHATASLISHYTKYEIGENRTLTSQVRAGRGKIAEQKKGGQRRAAQLRDAASVWKAKALPYALEFDKSHTDWTRDKLATEILFQLDDEAPGHRQVCNWLRDEIEAKGLIGSRARKK